MANRAKAKSKKARTGKVVSRGRVAVLPKQSKAAKGKGKKRGIGDNGGPGLTVEQTRTEITRLNRLHADWQKDHEVSKQSQGVYRSALKAAKKIGIDPDAYTEARDKDRDDHGKVLMHAVNVGRYLRVMKSPLATQMSLFQNLEEPEPAVDVALQGQNAGKGGEPAENNPHLPGSEDYQVWFENWQIGQGQLSKGIGATH